MSTDSKPTQPSHGLRNFFLAVLVLGILVALFMHWRKERDAISLNWAKKHGWRADAVVETELEPAGFEKWTGQAWRDLPFKIDPTEETDVNACVRLAKSINAKVDGKIRFETDETRKAIEEILERREDFFYAEFLLGVWHRRNGQEQDAEDYFELAYEHAPVVIVQPYRTASDDPLEEAEITSFALECNRVEKGSLNPNLKLYYPGLKTDDEGCIYLPVYDTVYRTDDMTYVENHIVEYPTLGYFEADGKMGVLPVAVARPRT